MNKKEVIAWYKDHSIEYIPEDWGRREDHGESAERNNALGDLGNHDGYHQSDRSSVRYVFPTVMDRIERGEVRISGLWPPRSHDNREQMEALDEFFAPYFVRLSTAKANLLREYLGVRRAQSDLARETGVTQQAVSKEVQSAIRRLTRFIAEDDPLYVPPKDRRRRDYAADVESAQRVLDAWWRSRFGRDYF